MEAFRAGKVENLKTVYSSVRRISQLENPQTCTLVWFYVCARVRVHIYVEG